MSDVTGPYFTTELTNEPTHENSDQWTENEKQNLIEHLQFPIKYIIKHQLHPYMFMLLDPGIQFNMKDYILNLIIVKRHLDTMEIDMINFINITNYEGSRIAQIHLQLMVIEVRAINMSIRCVIHNLHNDMENRPTKDPERIKQEYGHIYKILILRSNKIRIEYEHVSSFYIYQIEYIRWARTQDNHIYPSMIW